MPSADFASENSLKEQQSYKLQLNLSKDHLFIKTTCI